MPYTREENEFFSSLFAAKKEGPFNPRDFFSEFSVAKTAMGVAPDQKALMPGDPGSSAPEMADEVLGRALGSSPGASPIPQRMGPAARTSPLPNPTGAHGGGHRERAPEK